ncbi:MAG: TraR/DksA family transcriptional regulator [Nitriliruptorales bacterium]|nr:TraR/DksA family transcriptional regulator [Nitriliruptorales bacterium]
MSERAAKPKKPTKRLIASLRKQLEEERSELLAQAASLEADAADESWKEPRSDDDAETGTATFERERTMSLARNARQTVIQIDRALERMDAGFYGRCINCGEPIAIERLEALPQAVDCLDCRRKAERFR